MKEEAIRLQLREIILRHFKGYDPYTISLPEVQSFIDKQVTDIEDVFSEWTRETEIPLGE